jgi:hypothetical protein
MLINPRHKIPLDTAVANSTPTRRALVQNLYICAMREFTGERQQEPENFWIHRETRAASSRGGQAVTVTVTEMETGLFVQLTGTLSKASSEVLEGPYLTYGKKYLAETKSHQLQNTAVKIWR